VACVIHRPPFIYQNFATLCVHQIMILTALTIRNCGKWNLLNEFVVVVDSGFIWHKIIFISRFFWTWYCTARFEVNSECLLYLRHCQLLCKDCATCSCPVLPAVHVTRPPVYRLLSLHTTPQFTAYRLYFHDPLTSCAPRRCRRCTKLHDLTKKLSSSAFSVNCLLPFARSFVQTDVVCCIYCILRQYINRFETAKRTANV